MDRSTSSRDPAKDKASAEAGNYRLKQRGSETVHHFSTPDFTVGDLRPPDIKLTMRELLKWASRRLKEGSSWAGAAIIGAALGLPEEVVSEGIKALIAVSGLLAVILKDKPDQKDEADAK